MKDLFIGIDSGTNTGFAIWNAREKTLDLHSLKIHQAMSKILLLKDRIALVKVEDARKAVHGRGKKKDVFKAQGAGSVKRDATIWEDFLKDYELPFQMVRPSKKLTKKSHTKFKAITGWKGGRTNEHERDAAMLVWGYKPVKFHFFTERKTCKLL